MRVHREIRGYCDFVSAKCVEGWAYDRLVPDYDASRNRKVPGVEVPPLPIPGVTEPKKRKSSDTVAVSGPSAPAS